MGTAGRDALAAAASRAPHDPGVYVFLGGDGDVLYVGKAGNLRKRLQQHAKAGPPTSHLHGRYDRVRNVVWEIAPDEEAAAWREADLIFALAPPFNAAVVKDPHRFIVVRRDGVHRFAIEAAPGADGRTYGCFPHLGKGLASRLGIACSDGYVAFLRVLWAASGQGTHTPAAVTRSAPMTFEVAVAGKHEPALHAFLSGVSPKLLDGLATDERPAFMQPALARDRHAALTFFAAGPRALRARRLRHKHPAGPISAEDYRALVLAELSPGST
jgi:hypothetical protein